MFDPNTCKVQTEVAFAADRELDAAVANAAAAQPRVGAVAGMAPFNVAQDPMGRFG